MYVKYFTLLISKMYLNNLIRVLSFTGDVRFNVRGEHVPGCLGRGWGRGLVVSKMYLIRVLFFIGDVMFNVRDEHVPDCLGRG